MNFPRHAKDVALDNQCALAARWVVFQVLNAGPVLSEDVLRVVGGLRSGFPGVRLDTAIEQPAGGPGAHVIAVAHVHRWGRRAAYSSANVSQAFGLMIT